MVNSKAVRQALYQKLNVSSVTNLLGGGSASLVHAVANPQATFPLCVFQEQSARSVLRMGGNAFDSQLWLVKGVVRATSASVAEDIDKAVRDLLDFGTLTITGGTLLALTRESAVSYSETQGDVQYRHHGSLYRLVVSA
jgi:hypothetical protein